MIDVQAKLEKIKSQGRTRSRKISRPTQDGEIIVDGRSVVDFSSNDYLGLSQHSRVKAAMADAAHEFGAGAGASHLITGHHQLHEKAERDLAEFVGQERALLYSTGYMANLGVLSAFCDRNGELFLDKLSHASLIDGAQLTRSKVSRFKHNDLTSLAHLLSKAAEPQMVVTESVFSMDGDQPDLSGLYDLTNSSNSMLYIDEAHAIGVMSAGRGCCYYAGLVNKDNVLMMGTLGKAVGVFGAFVAGTAKNIDYLLQVSRTHTYTTATPPAVSAAVSESIQLIKDEPQRIEHLHQNIATFKSVASELGLTLLESDSAIQPVIVGDDRSAMRIESALLKCGYFVKAIRPPTVPEGTARLRFTINTHQNQAHYLSVLSKLKALINEDI